MTLYFVGIGISGTQSITEQARKAIASSGTVYAERFTSPIPDEEMTELEKIAKEGGAKFKLAPRWMVEDGRQILEQATKEDVTLVCFGDPYVATTHIELRTRAIAQKTETKTVHGASALTSMVGECGLHQYKVGRTSTVTSHEASTPYGILYENLQRGCHTVLLLEYDQDGGKFLDPAKALESLLEIEKQGGRGAATPQTFVLVASRIGRKNQSIVGGTIESAIKSDFGEPPHSIIVPGTLHFTESDAITALATCLDKPQANTRNPESEPHRMIAKYVPMIEEAIKDYRASNLEGATQVLDNAQNYVADAQKFLEEGKDWLAILSIGYADGLVDALRIASGKPYRKERE